MQPKLELKAVEEYAAECSMVKVFAAEMLDYVADEGVQIHGGYGFHQDYAVERTYRDARINRLFEGTSEINRLVISGMPLKRAARGVLPLLEAAQKELSNNSQEAKGADPEMQPGPQCEKELPCLRWELRTRNMALSWRSIRK